MPTTTPQDRKPKKTEGFQFTDKDGKSHTLPLASKGAEKMSGRDMRDALLGGDLGQITLGFKMLEACGASEEAIDAIYGLPSKDTMTVLSDWMSYGDGDGASAPQS
jgi:hypothetical protein